MLIQFFFTLRKYQVKVSLRELLDLLHALEKHIVYADLEGFYSLSRTIMVKDESQYDKFDRAFADYFEGVESIDLFGKDIPEEWLRKQIEKTLSAEEREALRQSGGLEALMDTLKKRLEEQEKRHQGGNKWVGTGGTSPFGAYGDNPEGIRIGQKGNRRNSAVKVWDKREFKNLSADVELGTRNIKVALRKLRKFARTGASEELDVATTIGETAKKGGMLDIHMSPERHNAVKVLMFLTWVALWILTLKPRKNFSLQCRVSLNTSSISIFITACMKRFGKITCDAKKSGYRFTISFIAMVKTIRSSLLAMPPWGLMKLPILEEALNTGTKSRVVRGWGVY